MDEEVRPKFRVSYKELIAIPAIAEKLRFHQKAERNLGGRKDIWCEFHMGFRHGVQWCMALGYQLAELLKEGLLKEYLEVDDREQYGEGVLGDPPYEIPVHAELNTISSGFWGGGSTATKRKRYARAVLTLEIKSHDDAPDPDLYFTKVDSVGVVPHDNDPVVISIVMVGRKVHRVLIDQGTSTKVLFWSTFVNLRLSPDQLRPHNNCLIGFAGDHVEC